MNRMAMRVTTALVVAAGIALTTGASSFSPHRGYYVAPNGSSGGDGTMRRPWNLATALSGARGRVQPGDTIWLLGGTYRGPFRSTVSGTRTAPVVVRQYPGERATIDGAGSNSTTLNVRGPWSIFWGFEVTNSDPIRLTAAGRRPNVIANYASHTKYINLIVHDGGVAFYTEPEYVDVEVAGCIIYNSGWQGPPPDRGHGHALYLKSYTGPVVARDNVMFNQFGYGVHAYTNARTGKLVNIRIEGNVAFNNGALATTRSAANILLGGDDYATGDVIRDNYTYQSPGYRAANVQVGYRTLQNGHVELLDNYFVGGDPVLVFGHWTSATVTGNTFLGTGPLVALNGPVAGPDERGSAVAVGVTLGSHVWQDNVHGRDPRASAWTYQRRSHGFNEWRAATGLAAADRAGAAPPTATKVVVRPNPYEAGRAIIVVYNWRKLDAVSVDLSGILARSSRYEVRNVQDVFGRPLVSGSFDGDAVVLPLAGVAPPIPVGLTQSRAPRTGPDFDVFLVTTP